ncbi:LacI family DNA-binding transcriptional regulator [Oerskovia flava]|uniref:LacI family DNA-binding transcriptional regulator n=1 Tax=Oerskovia flava TaxID=2986422 RepID=UPI0022406690|nr:LacI family DNA-binding transcriptional regulator [Oerskovia sp. JB1-3-2]
MKKATIKDVAHAAGVSTATVSHVVNGTKFVSQTPRQRVLDAVDALGYRPSGVASSLRRQSSRVVGLVLPMQDQDTSAAFFTRLAAGIENVLSRHGYRTIISNSVENYDREREQIGMLSGQFTDFVDGLILAPTVDNGHHAQAAFAASFPVVYVDRLPMQLDHDVDFVGTNNYESTLDGMHALFGRGFRDIACISSPIDVSSMVERHEAFTESVTTRVGSVSDRVFVTESSYDSGYRTGREVLERFPQLDALFIANNTVAMGVIRALMDVRGEAASSTGLLVYDDYEWMNLVQPAIDSIAQPAFAMGQAAAGLLLERLNDPSGPTRHEVVPSQLILRSSSTQRSHR